MDYIKIILFLTPTLLVATVLFTFVVVPIYNGNLSWRDIKESVIKIWDSVVEFVKDKISTFDDTFDWITNILSKLGITEESSEIPLPSRPSDRPVIPDIIFPKPI